MLRGAGAAVHWGRLGHKDLHAQIDKHIMDDLANQAGLPGTAVLSEH